MSDTITQANRLLEVPRPPALMFYCSQLLRLEGVSRPFRFTLKLVADVMNSMPAQVQPSAIVGQPMSIRISLSSADSASAGNRYISGMCERFSVEDSDDEFAHYTAVVVPWFSFLNYASNCRIFQDMTVPDIVAKVVQDLGYSAKLQNNTTKTYTTWDYCVQYRETDFNFISRLLEHEGIFYYFEHTASDHKMILADAPSCYTAIPVQTAFATPQPRVLLRWKIPSGVGTWRKRFTPANGRCATITTRCHRAIWR